MKRKTCMCGNTVEKSHLWDLELDQCRECAKDIDRKVRIREYMDTLCVGDLVWWHGGVWLLLEKTDNLDTWRLYNPTENRTKRFFPRRWHSYGSVGQLMSTIYKVDKKCPTDDLTND
jgi:hypothetical protein